MLTIDLDLLGILEKGSRHALTIIERAEQNPINVKVSGTVQSEIAKEALVAAMEEVLAEYEKISKE